MTPKEIEERFGRQALESLYDCLLQNPVHDLADWILSYHTQEQVGDWITQLQEDEETHHPDCPAVDGFGCRCDELEGDK
jgi:hypothetical protein